MYISKTVEKDLKLLIHLNLKDWKCFLEEIEDSEEEELGTLTVCISTDGENWGYQTGDNSFSGGAYLYPHWAVVYFNTSTTPEELLEDLYREIEWLEIYEEEEK